MYTPYAYLNAFLDGYCSTEQGLLDWFEVDLGFTIGFFCQVSVKISLFICLFSPMTLFVSLSLFSYVSLYVSFLMSLFMSLFSYASAPTPPRDIGVRLPFFGPEIRQSNLQPKGDQIQKIRWRETHTREVKGPSLWS